MFYSVFLLSLLLGLSSSVYMSCIDRLLGLYDNIVMKSLMLTANSYPFYMYSDVDFPSSFCSIRACQSV